MRRLVFAFAPLALVACASSPGVAPIARVAQAPSSAPSSAEASAGAAAVSAAFVQRLPDGWRAAEPPKFGRPVALHVETEALDIASLPVVEVNPRRDIGSRFGAIDPPRAPLAGPSATEVKTLGGRVTIAGHRFGGVSVGVGEMPFSDFTEGGTLLMNAHGVTQLAWTSFDAAADGALAVELVHGFYDADRRHGVESEHLRVRAAPIAGGAYHAFRTSCPACAPGERERLHLVGPGSIGNLDGDARREPTAGALVAYVSLPLDPGTAGGAAIFVGARDLIGWSRQTGLPVTMPGRAPVGFYASRGAGDASPVVVARMNAQ